MIQTPKLELLKIDDLHVDGYAQRDYRPEWAEELAKNWQPEKTGTFQVSRRDDGTDYVMDGQHRRGALLLRNEGDTVVPALVYSGLTKSEEAGIFLRDNVHNRKPNIFDIWRLSVVAEDPVVLEIEQVLKRHDLRVTPAMDPHSIAAVGALRWLYAQQGPELIDNVLTVLEQAWGGDRDSRDGQLLKAMGHFLLKTSGQRVNYEALTEKLGANGKPNQLVGRARSYREVTGRSLWMEVAHGIESVYNKGRTTNRVTI